MNNLSAIILTFNEELHLQRCIDSIKDICQEIVVIDSFSSDKTEYIAKKNNCIFLQNKFINQSNQINWFLTNYKIKTDWVLRIDADEILSEELLINLKNFLPNLSNNYTGIEVKRLMYFMGKPMKKGGMYPIWHLKLWRTGKAKCQQKWMDERMYLLDGNIFRCEGDLIDNNLNDIFWWTQKHNIYSTREAIEIIFSEIESSKIELEFSRGKVKKIYLLIPIFLRPFVFFVIRYFFQGGILEGKRGLIWNILQCFWYRFLVDVKIYEAKKKTNYNKEELLKHFKIENFEFL